ncbi:MAG: HAMP domain-containing histidine kinase [Firmicutes bacterium]|nr:HAMP domain-containing histidine kinase [Bacillota bacterium]
MISLRKRTIAGCILLIVAVFLAGGIAVRRILKLQSDADSAVMQLQLHLNEIERMRHSLERLDSAQLLFLLGYEGQAENIFAANEAEFTAALQIFREKGVYPEGEDLLADVEAKLALYLKSFAGMKTDADAGLDPGGRYSGESFPLYQALADDLRQLQNLSGQKLQEMVADHKNALNTVVFFVGFATVLTCLFAILLEASFICSIFRPLRLLAKRLRQVRLGDTTEVDTVSSSEEFNEVTKEFSLLNKLLRDYERFYKYSRLAAEREETAGGGNVQADRAAQTVNGKPRAVAELQMDLEDISVRELVDTAVQTLKSQAEAKAIRLLQEVPSDLPPIEADAHKVLWVLTNLIGNALRFTSSGGQVVVFARMVDGQVMVSVSDTGIGIDKAEQELLFAKYAQRTGEKKPGHKSGLGLTIAREIIQAHHGRIWVESEKDKGTTFTFTIPVKKQEQDNS